MDTHKTTLERAFDLARSGTYLTVAEIAQKLYSEGFAVAQIEGPALKKQLRELIEIATNQHPKRP